MNVTVLRLTSKQLGATALEVADSLGDRLWGVRLYTSEPVDRSLWTDMGDVRPTRRDHPARLTLGGRVRKALDASCATARVKIVRLGGFDAERSSDREFRVAGAPVTRTFVGSSLLSGSNDFTADSCWSTVLMRQRSAADGADTAPRTVRLSQK